MFGSDYNRFINDYGAQMTAYKLSSTNAGITSYAEVGTLREVYTNTQLLDDANSCRVDSEYNPINCGAKVA